MRSLICPILALAGVGAPAAPALPTFSDSLGQRPALSLAETIKSGALPPGDSVPGLAAGQARAALSRAATRPVSRMPIIVPPAEATRAMPIAKPDPAKEYALTVREPDIDSVK